MNDLIGIMILLCMSQKGFNNEHAVQLSDYRMIQSYLQTKHDWVVVSKIFYFHPYLGKMNPI